MLSVTIKKGVILQKTLFVDSSKKDTSNQDKSAYKLVRPGDIVYNKMRAWQGAIGVSEYRGIVSPAYVVQRLSDIGVPGYFHYLLRTPFFAKEAERWSYGITSDMWSLRPEHFKMIYVCLPPYPEQITIVRYLNYVDRRIRRYIRDKQKLIKLLEEQKQALIHRAVTRGLNPNIRLKPSGIDWLGDIPEHWNVLKLKHLGRLQSGDSITGLDIEQSGDYPVYGGNGLRGYTNNYTHEGDYVLIGRQGALCGNINYANGRFWASEHAVVVTLRSGISVYWFGELLKVMNLRQYSQSAAQPGLAVELIQNLCAPVPPAEEQRKIAEYFIQETKGIDEIINRTKNEIDLLREYRTRLVADVVTGKIDVREAAATIYEEPEETNFIDQDKELADTENDTENIGSEEISEEIDR